MPESRAGAPKKGHKLNKAKHDQGKGLHFCDSVETLTLKDPEAVRREAQEDAKAERRGRSPSPRRETPAVEQAEESDSSADSPIDDLAQRDARFIRNSPKPDTRSVQQQADLARLAVIRAQREEAARQRAAEAEAKRLGNPDVRPGSAANAAAEAARALAGPDAHMHGRRRRKR